MASTNSKRKKRDRKIMENLPSNYVSKPNTVVMVDNNGNYILHDNGDGTVSGLDIKLLNTEKL